jgi:streptogramin lyase
MKRIRTLLFAATVILGVVLQTAADTLYVTDSGDGSLKRIDSDGTITTVATGFDNPFGIAVDSFGNVFLNQGANGPGFTIEKVTPNRQVSTFANLGLFGGPTGMVFDENGNLYVASDDAAYTGSIKKITPAGVVSVFASGLAASPVSSPYGLAIDTQGNLYAALLGANTIAEVTPAGVVSTFASGFRGPIGMVFNNLDNNLYVVDAVGGATLDRVTLGGNVSQFASNLPGGSSGVAVDSQGYFYVSDCSLGTITKVTPEGVASPFVSGLKHPNFMAVVPEPASLSLIGLGVIAILFRRCRAE